MNKLKETYLDIKKKYNPKDKIQIDIKSFCLLFIEGKINKNEEDLFFSYKENCYINYYILGITLAEELKEENNVAIFLKKLAILDKGYPEGNYIAMEAFRNIALENLYNNNEETVFFKTIKQIPQYINKYPEKIFRFSNYKHSEIKRYIKQWEKVKNIQDILIGRDLLISNCQLESNYIVPIFKAILDKNIDDFIQYLSSFKTPVLLNRIAHTIVYSDLELKNFFEIIKKAPYIINNRTNQWNGSFIILIFVNIFFNRIKELYTKQINTEDYKKTTLENIEKLINIILDRKCDGKFIIENLFYCFSKNFFMKQEKETDIFDNCLEILKKTMKEKKYYPEDIFKNINDLTSLALLIHIDDTKSIKKEHIELLETILNYDDKININFNNFRGLSMFEKIHDILAYLFTFGEYEKNWFKSWNKFKEKRLSYTTGYNENYYIMNSSLYLLILGTTAIDYLIQTKQQFLSFANLVWNKVMDFYLINKPLSEVFCRNIIPYLITLYCIGEQKEIAYEKIKYIISNRKILFATLALLDQNDVPFDFIHSDEKKLCINNLLELKEISQFDINSKNINESLLDKLIEKLKS